MKTAKLKLTTYQVPGPYVNIRYLVRWEGEDVSLRKPEEQKKEFCYPGLFWAAGRVYHSWKDLCHKKLDEDGHVCRDIYGREVLAVWERFPCFDSYDYLYENRYYRWFFIREEDALTCVDYTDEQKRIKVTEDAGCIREKCWKLMKELNWQQ